jgi:hypothetical protein
MLTDEPPVNVDGKQKTINWNSVNANVDLILCGHYHPGWKGVRTNKLMGTRFVNPGAMTRQEASEVDMYRKPKICVITVKNKSLRMKFKVIPHRKDVFDLELITGKKLAEGEKLRFVEALNSIKDSDIMGSNVLNILERFKDIATPELCEMVTDKVLAMCKLKIEEMMES